LVVAAAQVSWWYADIHASSSTEEARRSLKRFTMKRYRPKFVGVLFKSINSAKKALFVYANDYYHFIAMGMIFTTYISRLMGRNMLQRHRIESVLALILLRLAFVKKKKGVVGDHSL
jgi:hypothetical protein